MILNVCLEVTPEVSIFYGIFLDLFYQILHFLQKYFRIFFNGQTRWLDEKLDEVTKKNTYFRRHEQNVPITLSIYSLYIQRVQKGFLLHGNLHNCCQRWKESHATFTSVLLICCSSRWEMRIYVVPYDKKIASQCAWLLLAVNPAVLRSYSP